LQDKPDNGAFQWVFHDGATVRETLRSGRT